jgi:hypothetical protein
MAYLDDVSDFYIGKYLRQIRARPGSQTAERHTPDQTPVRSINRTHGLTGACAVQNASQPATLGRHEGGLSRPQIPFFFQHNQQEKDEKSLKECDYVSNG